MNKFQCNARSPTPHIECILNEFFNYLLEFIVGESNDYYWYFRMFFERMLNKQSTCYCWMKTDQKLLINMKKKNVSHSISATTVHSVITSIEYPQTSEKCVLNSYRTLGWRMMRASAYHGISMNHSVDDREAINSTSLMTVDIVKIRCRFHSRFTAHIIYFFATHIQRIFFYTPWRELWDWKQG